MLEVRYNTETKEITGWWGSRFGNHKIKLKNRTNEAIATLDIDVPNKPLEAWLFEDATQSLIPNPSYVEPVARDLAEEVDEIKAKIADYGDLKARIESLEGE